MIRVHEANSRWWGSPVGIVTDPAFFDLESPQREALLDPYSWVEFKAALPIAPAAMLLQRAGFAWTDVQIDFRIALQAIPHSPSLEQYECLSAAEEPFTVTARDVRSFQHERFLQLPGASRELLDARYAAWANELVSRDPAWCLRVSLGGRTQGWFLAEPKGSTLALTLAMLAADATASGHHVYQRCLRDFARRGGTVGIAAFSIRNTPVLNIYASLAARFTTTTGVWIWVAQRSERTPVYSADAAV
jgi:hypothetical protein